MSLRAVVAAVGTLVLTLVGPAAALASAAPEYQSSEPAAGSKTHEAPESVTVTFSEPLDPSSDLTVTDECGRTIDDGNVEVFANEMSVGLAEGPAGRYEVSYVARGVAGVTGTTEGSFHFDVHAGPACDGGGGHEGHGGSGNGNGGHEGGHGGNDPGRGNEHRGHGPGPGPGPGHQDHDNEMTTGHDGHDGMGPAQDGRRKGRGGHEGHDRRNRDPDPPQDPDDRDIALGPDGETGAAPTATATTAFVALGLASVFGFVGGWLLRISSPR